MSSWRMGQQRRRELPACCCCLPGVLQVEHNLLSSPFNLILMLFAWLPEGRRPKVSRARPMGVLCLQLACSSSQAP